MTYRTYFERPNSPPAFLQQRAEKPGDLLHGFHVLAAGKTDEVVAAGAEHGDGGIDGGLDGPFVLGDADEDVIVKPPYKDHRTREQKREADRIRRERHRAAIEAKKASRCS